MQKNKVILDYSMRGFEGGIPRIYRNLAPSITARLYKEPWRIAIICRKKK